MSVTGQDAVDRTAGRSVTGRTGADAKPAALMPAWQVTALGEPADVLARVQVPVPVPGPGQVLIEVGAAGLNFADVLMSRGQYQDRPAIPFTPGIELCGRVVAAGAGATGVVGNRVVATTVLPHGALARYAVAEARDAFAAPAALDDASAAVLHVSYQTAWFGLYRRAVLRVGETLLVHAAAGGVGSAAVQLGKAAGARVIGVVGGAAKAEAARQSGADVIIDRSSQDVVEAVREVTGGRGVDVVFDPVGGSAFVASTKVVAFEGRIVAVGFAGGQIPMAATNHLLVKNYAVLGLHWGLYRSRDPELVARAQQELDALVAAGAVRPLVADRLPFADASAGLARLASGTVLGRLAVLAPGPD